MKKKCLGNGIAPRLLSFLLCLSLLFSSMPLVAWADVEEESVSGDIGAGQTVGGFNENDDNSGDTVSPGDTGNPGDTRNLVKLAIPVIQVREMVLTLVFLIQSLKIQINLT